MSLLIDYFIFFNEKELLELRINLLKDYVDKFIISEANKTHSGNKKEFLCKKLIKELNLPEDKIEVIEVDIPDDNDIQIIESDCVYSSISQSTQIKNWSRERIQRDILMNYISDYDDDTVFILSDCDEIIDPKYLSYFTECIKKNSSSYIKVSLVPLEGRADKRLCDNNGICHWDRSMVICTKKQLANNGSPTKFRGEYNSPIGSCWITENNQVIRDCGWHFTWMGGENNRLIKSQNTIHAENLSVLDNLSSDSMQNISNNKSIFSLIDYDIDYLPKTIFELPSVKDFLFQSNLSKEKVYNIKKIIYKIYDDYDKILGVWGWCPNEKADKIIDCVVETCSHLSNPVCVEIGVYAGKSLFPFGLALKYLNKGIIYAIDPWLNSEATVGYDGVHYDFWSKIPLEWAYNVCLTGLDTLQIKDFVKIIRETSDHAPQIDNICVLHIDGQHTDQLIRDINKYATCVVDSGYCFLDDIEWSEETQKSTSLIESLGFVKIDHIQGCFVYKKIPVN